MRALCCGLLVFSLPALAVEPGQPLFVSVNDAALRDQPKDKARKLTTCAPVSR